MKVITSISWSDKRSYDFCFLGVEKEANSIHWKCEECGWIDDEYQNTHPDSLNGPNEICLNEARVKVCQKK